MSPALNGSSVLQLFEHGKVVEIRNGVMFHLPMTATYVVQGGDIFIASQRFTSSPVSDLVSHLPLFAR